MLCFLLPLYLQNVDICDWLYGQPTEIEALLGYDFLEGSNWRLTTDEKLKKSKCQTLRRSADR